MSRFDPTFDFVIASAAGDVLVQGNDPRRNAITATLVNTGDDLMLKADGDERAEMGLGFGTLLDSRELESLAISAEGWTAELDRSARPYLWRLRVEADLRWAKGARLVFSIVPGSVGAESRTGPHRIEASCLNLRDAADEHRICEEKARIASLILVANAGQPRKTLKEVLGCYADPDAILTWNRTPEPVTNTLTLTLANLQRDEALLPAGGPSGQPVFKIVFPTVPHPSGDPRLIAPDALRALTYPDLAQAIEITLPVDCPWEIRKFGDDLYWEVRPKLGNATLLEPGGALVLTVSGIVSPLSPAKGAYPTRIYVLYAGVGDYDDGYFSTVLFKQEPEPRIISFKAADAEVDYGGGTTLSWTTVGAERIEISFAKGPESIRWTNTDGPEGRAFNCSRDVIEIPVKGSELTETTTYTLSLSRGDVVLREVATVSVRRPELSFTATAEVAQGGLADIGWKITGPWPISKLSIAMDGRVFAETPAARGSVMSPPIDETTGFTLTAVVAMPKPLTLTSVAKTIVKPASVGLAGPDGVLALGDVVSLDWTADFVNCVEIFTPGEAQASQLIVTMPTVHAGGSIKLKPRRTTTYTLHGEGRGGRAIATKTVNMRAVDIQEFVIRPSLPADGHVWGENEGWSDALVLHDIGYCQVEVAGRVSYATDVWIEQSGMDPLKVWGAGASAPLNPDGAGDRFKVRFKPLGDCTFSLNAAGPGGTVQRTVPVRHERGPKISQASLTLQGEGTDTVLAFSWTASGSSFSIGTRDPDMPPFPLNISMTDHPMVHSCFRRIVDIEESRSLPWHAFVDDVEDIWGNPDHLSGTLDKLAFYVIAWNGSGLPAIRSAKP